VTQGKAACKEALQVELGLPIEPRVPLAGFVGRLTDQKGVDLIASMIQDWVQAFDVQWVILGTGDPKYHELFKNLAQRYPRRVAAQLAFSDPMAHRIEGGADIFLMPSQFEPCGLSQLYSLKYGAVPVVRSVGGLADTITDTTNETLTNGTANGFSFREYSPLALSETLKRACLAYTQPDRWQRIVEIGMRQDWSWAASAKQYVNLYQQTLARAERAEPAISN
jgi:starch synthase